ncbi:MAG: hypothetical protein ACLQBA_13120, partial [Candidatus Binataceae bacterium]
APAIRLHGVILRHPPPSGCELWLNSPDLDAFSLFPPTSRHYQTYFWPKQIICEQTPGTCNEWANSLDWDTLLKSLKGGVKQIQFDLVAEVYGHDNLTATCVANVNPAATAELESCGWYTLLCK